MRKSKWLAIQLNLQVLANSEKSAIIMNEAGLFSS